MALPVLETMKYKTKIPSLDMEVWFRPYVNKEEKILLMAMETEKEEVIVKALIDIIDICLQVPENKDLPNIKDLPLFDIQFLFSRIRAKSVDEVVEFKHTCPHCKNQTSMEVNIEDMKIFGIEKAKKDNKVMINDSIGVMLHYPNYEAAKFYLSMDEKGSIVEARNKLVIGCISKVFDNEAVYNMKDESEEEKLKFFDSIPVSVRNKIEEWIEDQPEFKHNFDYVCEKCGKPVKFSIQGVYDFFT